MAQFDEYLQNILGESQKPERRKCFISYFHDDQNAVNSFVEDFNSVLIPKAIGISEKDDFINSNDPEYVMARIRQDILGDSTVTICLIGNFTHSRRYIDWELKASLRQGTYTPNRIIGILLPHMGNKGYLPQRLKDNWSEKETECYALYRSYPNSEEQLRNWIESAYSRRESHTEYIMNKKDMMKYNGKCIVHNKTH